MTTLKSASIPTSDQLAVIAEAIQEDADAAKPQQTTYSVPAEQSARAKRINELLELQSQSIAEFAQTEFAWSAKATTATQLERGRQTDAFVRKIVAIGEETCAVQGRPFDRGVFLKSAFKSVATSAATLGERYPEHVNLRWVAHLIRDAIKRQLGPACLDQAERLSWTIWTAHITRKPAIVDYTNLTVSIDPDWVEWLGKVIVGAIGSKDVRKSYQSRSEELALAKANAGKTQAQLEREENERKVAEAKAAVLVASTNLDSALAVAVKELPVQSIRAAIRAAASETGIDPVTLATESAPAGLDARTVEVKEVLDLIKGMIALKRFDAVHAIFRNADAILAMIAAEQAQAEQAPVAMAG